ncbi:hypothetical protein BZG78_15195 [Salinivibrio sp. MA351]|uniref:hypothetical protein n=1 Tax=unclassified Salinivibrio TaxID=2636825 RepID=UPI00098990AE|nr:MULTISPECIES: hypothetical protein [unclassified Salinivibrio]OOE95180.1 hypothetical protein BZG78_15195 [Salinivibrio sp. MA351]OOF01517.1 hypothetical protein BZG80_15550 [Salinivibrio sp. MA440]
MLEVLNVIGTWLAGIGTIAAAVTSLWFARRENKIELAVKVDYRQLVTRGQSEATDLLRIHVVNKGVRPANITKLGWFVGRFKNKKHLVQLLGDVESDTIPKMLYEGEEANFLIHLSRENKPFVWIESFIKDVLQPNPKKQLKTLRLMVYTSVGQNFKTKIDHSLNNLFLNHIS